jgi:protease secretion system outer membrane protein
LRAAEVDLRLQLQSVVASIASANQSLDIQRQAIAAAELSVDANQQSYQGGVRSSVDVLNAIQTLYTVQSEYVNLATTQAQNHLSLLLLLGQDGVDAIAQIQANLFTP